MGWVMKDKDTAPQQDVRMGAMRPVEDGSGDGPPRYAFDLLTPGRGLGTDVGVRHAVFTRRGGVSATPFDSLNVSASVGDDPAAVDRNRDLVLAALERPRASLVMAGLVHGTTVARVTAESLRRGQGQPLPNPISVHDTQGELDRYDAASHGERDRPASLARPLPRSVRSSRAVATEAGGPPALPVRPSSDPEVGGPPALPVRPGSEDEPRVLDRGYVAPDVDALVTDDPDVTLLVTAADCAQVFVVDPHRPAVGLAHAGWRGTAAGVLTATVEAMRRHFGSDPADLRATVGPCLGPCCAQFSDPHRELPAWCAPFIHGDHVDLWAMNRQQLLGAGLRPEHIAVAEVCTVCNRDLFFSHRGDHGRTGRFAAVISLDR